MAWRRLSRPRPPNDSRLRGDGGGGGNGGGRLSPIAAEKPNSIVRRNPVASTSFVACSSRTRRTTIRNSFFLSCHRLCSSPLGRRWVASVLDFVCDAVLYRHRL